MYKKNKRFRGNLSKQKIENRNRIKRRKSIKQIKKPGKLGILQIYRIIRNRKFVSHALTEDT